MFNDVGNHNIHNYNNYTCFLISTCLFYTGIEVNFEIVPTYYNTILQWGMCLPLYV